MEGRAVREDKMRSLCLHRPVAARRSGFALRLSLIGDHTGDTPAPEPRLHRKEANFIGAIPVIESFHGDRSITVGKDCLQVYFRIVFRQLCSLPAEFKGFILLHIGVLLFCFA